MDIRGNFNRQKGWAGTNPGWYQLTIVIEGPRESILKYLETIAWLGRHVDGYHKHVCWMYAGNYLKYKFRYERDYVWFKMRWQ